MLRTRIGVTAAVLSLGAASGCAWFEEPEEDLDFEAYEGRLTEMYNESGRLMTELDEAEARIVQDCMGEQGFEVHPTDEFTSWGQEPRETFMDSPAYESFLPSAEDAQRRGFWQWTAVEGAEAVEEEGLYAEWEAHELAEYGWMHPEGFGEGEELPEFYLLDSADQRAWYVAYAGEAWTDENYVDLDGAEDDGERTYTNPPPEGCLLEMIEAVYGGLQTSDNDEEGWTEWSFRPEQPNGDWSEMTDRYVERLADAEPDFLDCLADRGRDGWEFFEGQLWVHSYLHESGEGEYARSSHEGSGTVWPDPPEDAPDADDVEGWLAFERALAVDFAECGDETGFREAAEHAWQQAQLHYYLDIEDDTYAWQEEMRGYLETAQEVIGV